MLRAEQRTARPSAGSGTDGAAMACNGWKERGTANKVREDVV